MAVRAGRRPPDAPPARHPGAAPLRACAAGPGGPPGRSCPGGRLRPVSSSCSSRGWKRTCAPPRRSSRRRPSPCCSTGVPVPRPPAAAVRCSRPLRLRLRVVDRRVPAGQRTGLPSRCGPRPAPSRPVTVVLPVTAAPPRCVSPPATGTARRARRKGTAGPGCSARSGRPASGSPASGARELRPAGGSVPRGGGGAERACFHRADRDSTRTAERVCSRGRRRAAVLRSTTRGARGSGCASRVLRPRARASSSSSRAGASCLCR